MALWTSEEAEAATGGTSTREWAATGVSIDTRTLQPGDLFVALTDVRDGHDFVAQAIEKGAAAALVTHRPDGVAEDAPLLVVPDALDALEELGKAARARTEARVLAITGSVGKTSAKEMAREILSAQGRTHVAEASYNNQWGVPLTLARMPVDTEFAVIEIGMNHPGEIAPLARMARPHVAMITTVAAAHLEAFENIEGIAREKGAIFEGLEPEGTAVINMDLETSDVLLSAANSYAERVIGFGGKSDWTLRNVNLQDGRTIAQATTPDGDIVFKLETAGRHFAMNGLGCLAATAALGADPALGALSLAAWVPPSGRGTREVVALDPAKADETFILLDDAFNANPTSLSAALEVLDSYTPRDGVGRWRSGRRVAILGDMLELGPDEVAMHVACADDAHMKSVDIVHCAGPLMHSLYVALPDHQRGVHAQTAQELVAQISELVDAGDVVLVKGSKGSKVSLVVDALRKLGHPHSN